MTDQKRRILFMYCLVIAACWLLAFSACDDSFQPLQENDIYNFNISGYLDASADTQWVRVGTIRESIDEAPDPTGIQVTLENLQSGETVVMNDSVFTSRNVLNYWTTMDIENEQTYRITAGGADGRASRVTVTTPMELPSIYILLNALNSFDGESTIGANIYIDDVAENIVDLQSVWFVTLNSGTEIQKKIYRFPLRKTLQYTFSIFGAYTTLANWEEEREQIEQNIGGAEIKVASRQFFVAIGGPEWNDSLSSINSIEYFIDGTASNIENGLGYVVGIDSGWYHQVPCQTPDNSGFAPCREVEPFW